MVPGIVGFYFHRGFYADTEKRWVLHNGKPLEEPLTQMEFAVLDFFLRRSRQLISRDAVVPLNQAFHDRPPIDDYVAKINRKLGLQRGEIFVVARGMGFTLQTNVRPVHAAERQTGFEVLKAADFNFNFHTIDLMEASLQQSLKILELNPHGLPQANITAAYNYINLGQAAYAARVPKTVFPEARKLALEAAKYPETAAAAHGILALLQLIYDYDWERAETEFEIALSLDPEEPATLLSYAHFLVTSGKFQEAVDAVERAARLTPDDRIIYVSWGWIHSLAGNPQEGIRLGTQALELHPGFPPGHILLGWAYEDAGQDELALEHYKLSIAAEYSPAALASLGHLYGKTGRHDRAMQLLDKLEELKRLGKIQYAPAYCRALVYAGLKEVNKCLAELERAYDEHCDWLIHLVLNRRWDSVRDDARFRLLVTRVGIPYSG